MHQLAVGRLTPRIIGTCVNEHHTSDIRRVSGSVEAYQPAAVRMTDEDEMRLHARLLEYRRQLVYVLVESPRMRSEVAPTIASAVVGTDPREARDARLNQTPLHGEITDPGLENNVRL